MKFSQTEMQKNVDDLGPWFHNLTLNGIQTAPHHFLGDYPSVKWNSFQAAIPPDLTGKSVLDIGCNAGFYSIEMKKRGAERVVAIDSDAHYLAQARFAAEVYERDIEFRKMSVYEVADLQERFDFVLFLGVFYHLRHPLLALDLLHQHVVDDWLVFQSLLRGETQQMTVETDYDFSERAIFSDVRYPTLSFIERKYAHDPTNWWFPNKACAKAMLRSAGFAIEANPEDEVFVCRRDPGRDAHPVDFMHAQPVRA